MKKQSRGVVEKTVATYRSLSVTEASDPEARNQRFPRCFLSGKAPRKQNSESCVAVITDCDSRRITNVIPPLSYAAPRVQGLPSNLGGASVSFDSKSSELFSVASLEPSASAMAQRSNSTQPSNLSPY